MKDDMDKATGELELLHQYQAAELREEPPKTLELVPSPAMSGFDSKRESRRNIINLYIIVEELWDVVSSERDTPRINVYENKLVEAKAKHLMAYSEEVHLTVRGL